jgi:glutamate---cysteine ligase / carboxylate-amine ligase
MRRLGVEEELLLVDPVSGVPAAVAGTLLRFVRPEAAEEPTADHENGGELAAELQQQQIEVDTRPSGTLAELSDQLRDGRRRAGDLAARTGARVAALATSPLPVTPETTRTSRYLAMVDHFGLTTAEQLTCGCHIHVEVTSDDEGVGVLDRIRVWLPVLLALSANSPFWQGRDSGYASFRSQAWNRFPSAGPTQRWGSAASYHRELEAMVSSGVLLDRHMAYFDARLSDRYPTVEIRVPDVCLSVADTVLVAALVRALVETAAGEWAEGRPAPDVSAGLLRLATWRAGRSGLAGDLLDPFTARPRPAEAVTEQLLSHVWPELEAAGDTDQVDCAWRDLRARGTGADFQRRVWQESGDLTEVVRQSLTETLAL